MYSSSYRIKQRNITAFQSCTDALFYPYYNLSLPKEYFRYFPFSVFRNIPYLLSALWLLPAYCQPLINNDSRQVSFSWIKNEIRKSFPAFFFPIIGTFLPGCIFLYITTLTGIRLIIFTTSPLTSPMLYFKKTEFVFKYTAIYDPAPSANIFINSILK